MRDSGSKRAEIHRDASPRRRVEALRLESTLIAPIRAKTSVFMKTGMVSISFCCPTAALFASGAVGFPSCTPITIYKH